VRQESGGGVRVITEQFFLCLAFVRLRLLSSLPTTNPMPGVLLCAYRYTKTVVRWKVGKIALYHCVESIDLILVMEFTDMCDAVAGYKHGIYGHWKYYRRLCET
jgi:hypothetical protein